MKVLFAIGGNIKLDGSIMNDFIQRCGGGDARIVVIPTASSRISGGNEYTQAIESLSPGISAKILPVRERAHAFNPQNIEIVQNASGIFFTGGDQLRLATVFAGTPLLEAIRLRFSQGAVVAGTSAGTAILGRVMITGGQSGSGARSGSAQFAEGLNFESKVLFDQHFHQRNRLGRLMFAINVHPHLLGIGIDEDTAAVISEDVLEVTGERSVTIVDGQGLTESNVDQVSRGGWLSFSYLRMHQLTSGCKFDLNLRTAQIMRKALQKE